MNAFLKSILYRGLSALRRGGCVGAALFCLVVSARAQCITPLIQWEGNNGLPTPTDRPDANSVDSDGDGIPNLLEWAFNLPPNIPGQPIVPSITGTNGLPRFTVFPGNPTNVFTVEYIRLGDAALSGVSYRVETAASLAGPWIEATNGESILPTPNGSPQHVVAGVQPLGNSGAQQFCRVAVIAGPVYCPETVYHIKQGVAPGGSTVSLMNMLVTGVASDGFFLQVKAGDFIYSGSDYSGIFVHTGTNSALLAGITAGIRVTVNATVVADDTHVVLDQVSSVTIVQGFSEAPPAPISVLSSDVAAGAARSYPLDGMIVQLGPPAQTVSVVSSGEFSVTDNSHVTVISEALYTPAPQPVIGQTYTSITGINSLQGSTPRIEPRSEADLVQ